MSVTPEYVCMVFAGVRYPIEFSSGSTHLLKGLERLLAGWSYRVAHPSDPAPQIRVRHDGGQYRIDAPWLEQPVYTSCAHRATGHLAVDVIEAYLHTTPQRLCWHGGAVEIKGRLIIFPAPSRAGKSTLMAGFAAAGFTVYSDDVIPIDTTDSHGESLGMALRLRLPLPVDASPRLRDFVAQHTVLMADRYAYVAPESRPRFKRRAPLGAVVLLERRDSGAAVLQAVSPGDGLHALIGQNLAPHLTAHDLLARTHALMTRLPCFRLVYADIDEATTLIGQTFTDTDTLPVITPTAPWTAIHSPPPREQTAILPQTDGYQRHPAVQLRAIDEQLFLVHEQTQGIYRLNPIAAGLWHLLETPLSIDDAVTLLQTVFPDTDPAQISADVMPLFAELVSRDLIVCQQTQ